MRTHVFFFFSAHSKKTSSRCFLEGEKEEVRLVGMIPDRKHRGVNRSGLKLTPPGGIFIPVDSVHPDDAKRKDLPQLRRPETGKMGSLPPSTPEPTGKRSKNMGWTKMVCFFAKAMNNFAAVTDLWEGPMDIVDPTMSGSLRGQQLLREKARGMFQWLQPLRWSKVVPTTP